MSLADNLTVLILTYNEQDNIGRALDSVRWAKRVIVLDSGSTDATREVVGRFANAEIMVRPFDTFAGQCNYGLSQIASDWVLSLDADYVISDGLAAEICAIESAEDISGYAAEFIYCIHGKPLRSTLYPPRHVLYRRERARYNDVGHGHRVEISGGVSRLQGKILHDDRKPLSRWLASQQAYARREADYLLAARPETLRRTDRLRSMAWPAPIAVFLYTLIVKRCLLDGWAGWSYVWQRTLAETMIALEVIDRRMSRTGGGKPR